MATGKKKKKKSKKSKVAKVSAVTSSPAVLVATRTLATLTPLTADARSAFLGQTHARERADLGGKTKAVGVLRNVGTWIPIIASALEKFDGAIPYSKARLAFLCESVLALNDVIAQATKSRSGAVAANASRDAAIARAREVRKDLLHALGQVTRGTSAAGKVATVERRGEQDDVIASSLSQFADIADDVLAQAKSNKGIAALIDAVLSPDLVAMARAVADDLTSAGASRITSGSARAKDPPEVNLAEGTVLAEMRVVRNAFERAHEKNRNIPRLIPGPETRTVLSPHPKKKKTTSAPAPEPSAPLNGA